MHKGRINMIDFLTGLKLGADLLYFIPPLIFLIVVPLICALIYAGIFHRILPAKIYNFFLGPSVLVGFYIWAVPMKIGFYEFFRAAF